MGLVKFYTYNLVLRNRIFNTQNNTGIYYRDSKEANSLKRHVNSIHFIGLSRCFSSKNHNLK